jgi:chromosome segregation ATPase
MASIRIRCGFAGCAWKGELESYDAHVRECPAKKLKELRAERDEKSLAASEVEALREAAQERDEEIEELKVKLEQNRSLVVNLSSMFDSAMGEIRSKQMKIIAMEARLDDKEAQIKTQKEQLSARGKQIAAKDKVLKEQLFILRSKDNKVGELCETLRQTLTAFDDYKDKVKGELESQRLGQKTNGRKRKFEQSLLPSGTRLDVAR